MYRKFWLVNSLGNKYELSNKNYKHFLNTPTNLGFAKDLSTIRLGNVEKITSENFQLLTPQGEMIFYGNTSSMYEEYYNFIRFISFQPLELYYLPPNQVEDAYFCKGVVIQTDKSEVSAEDGVLHCPFYFKSITAWETSKVNTLSIASGASGTGKTYPISYPYHYVGNTLSDISITNSGTLPTGFVVEITGETTNPQFSIYDAEGNLYGICKITGTYDYILIDSIDGEESIYLEYNDSIIANPSSYQDLSVADGNTYVTFVKLQVGVSKMVFALGGSFSGNVNIKWRNAFISV